VSASANCGVIYVGAPSEAEQPQKRLKVDDAIAAVRAAAEEGISRGGGTAYLNCIDAVRALPLEGDEAVGRDILIHGLEAPVRKIAINSGFNPDVILDNIRRRPVGFGFDVMSEQYVDMFEAGVIDAVKVARTALEKGVSGAMMALTTEALVRTRNEADFAVEP